MPFETVFDNYSEFEELIRCIQNNITPVNVITGVGAQRAHPPFWRTKKAEPAYLCDDGDRC